MEVELLYQPRLDDARKYVGGMNRNLAIGQGDLLQPASRWYVLWYCKLRSNLQNHMFEELTPEMAMALLLSIKRVSFWAQKEKDEHRDITRGLMVVYEESAQIIHLTNLDHC